MRSMKSLMSIAAALVLIGASACSDDSGTTTTDGKVTQDAGPDGSPPTEITCDGDCFDFVLDSLTFPDSTTASQIGHDYDGDGAIDNAFGSILAALSGAAGDLKLQEAVNGGIYAGSTIILLRVQADDPQNDPATAAQSWVGEGQNCCTTPDDLVACKTEADQSCFSGSHAFWPSNPTAPKAMFGGSITEGRFNFGPSTMKLILPVTTQGTLDLDLVHVYIKGKMSADGKTITDGVLSGAITKSELDTEVIPTVTDMMNNTLQTSTDETVKNSILELFDTDEDGAVSEEEVRGNALISLFLGGDIDVTGNGQMELTMGVGFTAISAEILESNPGA